jgi:hypothetical protein
MRTMLQLLGGVAVAGAVAAGSTAFTANSGLTTTLPSQVVVGGAKSVTVIGAVLTEAHFTVATSPAVDNVTGVNVVVTDGTSPITANATVTAKISGTPSGIAPAPASGAALTCTYNSGTSLWVCPVGGAYYYTGVSALSVEVVTL